MKRASFTQYIISTAIAVFFLAMVYIVISRFLLHSLFDLGKDGAEVYHAVLGIIIILAIDPVRAQTLHILYRLVYKRDANFDELQSSIAALFTSEIDFSSTCESLRKQLRDAFKADDVSIVVRFQGQFVQIESDGEIEIVESDPLAQHLSQYPDPADNLYRDDRTMGSASHSHDHLLMTFLERDIVYALPLTAHGTLLGWIAIHSDSSSYHITQQEQHFLIRIQSIISIGLRRAVLHRHLQHRLDQLIALQRISQTMNSSLNVNETLESVMDAVVELTNADRAIMYLRDDEGNFIPKIGRGFTDDISLDFVIETDKSVFKHLVETQESLVVKDVATDPRVNQAYSRSVKTSAFVAVPMMSKERIIGIVGVDNLYSNRPIEDINTDMLVTLANQSAIAIENSQLYEQTQELNMDLAGRVAEATTDLQKLLDVKSQFVAMASHQMRTPTTIAKGMLSMLEEDEDLSADEQKEFINQASASVNRLERIITELLSATRLEDRTDDSLVEPIELRSFIHEIIADLLPVAQQEHIDLATEIPSSVPRLYSDAVRLKEAITNLVDNAIRYTLEGSVVIRLRIDSTDIVFDIIDTGVGMDEEDLEVIFNKFERGPSISEIRPDGTGLGLYIAKQVAESLGGSLHAASEGKGKGSTFTLRVPLRKQVQDLSS